MLFLIWTISLTAALVLYFRRIYSRFSTQGVKNPKVLAPFGNMTRVLLRYEHIAYNMDEMYKLYPKERFYGKYDLVKPIIVIRDSELIKKVTIKDFEYFLDHAGFGDSSDELFSRNLFALRGEEWKEMRSTLSPAFTSSKIKLMVPFMEEAGEIMLRAIKRNIKESKSEYIEVECKDLTTRYANDVIASCAFGLKVDSHTDPQNQFYLMGKAAATFKFRQILTFFVMNAAPVLAKVLKLTFLSKDTQHFFLDLVLNTMKERESRNIIRNDMIHLLMEAKKGQLAYDGKPSDDIKDTGFAAVEETFVGGKKPTRAWSDKDLVAQAVIFFIAGFESISSVMSLALHELAINPGVQERLAQEIKENDAKHGGVLDYNSVLNMKYLDMVVSELLRLWPAGIMLDRQCAKDYNLGKPNKDSDVDYIVRKGEAINIPVWSIHHDAEYYLDPEKFDPERFSDEKKHLIKPMTYIPFGLGPRNCIGSRFALCEIKVLIYQILRHMELTPSERTQRPGRLSADYFNIRLEGGHWLRFRCRDI